jgi:gamma-D-glutamyl-L-lysine dipeptidyl-peptidase
MNCGYHGEEAHSAPYRQVIASVGRREPKVASRRPMCLLRAVIHVLFIATTAGCLRPVPPDGTMAPATATVASTETTELRMQSNGVVIDGIADLYSEPSKAVDLVTQAVLGTQVAIWETREGWYYVRLPDQYRGWIEASHVRLYEAGEAPYASEGQVAEVQSLWAFVYIVPRVSTHPPVVTAPLGTRLEIQSEEDTWLRVVLPDRSLRWIQKGDVFIEPAATPRRRGSQQELVDLAKRFLGLPYLWGGTTPLGIDCSGLVQLVYHLNGVELLRDADIQYSQPGLRPVAKEELETGDLIFFGESSITHVGMYVGEGEFIHATTHLQPVVQISSLQEAHWTELYQGARRP